MPVIDLKDYLGMPQQAPTQPVFQSTTQSLDPMALRAYDPYSNEAMLANVEGRQRLAGLQRLAPAIQAQQAQLAYDKIGEEARVLRQKQEVEAQVQRATDELLGGALNPESTDFSQQATQFYGRNQLAFLDPRMREAMSFLQKQNQDYTTRQNALQRAEMKTAQQMFKAQQDEINRIDELRIDAIDSGAPRELVLAAKSPYEIASLKAQYGGRTEKDIRGQMMEKDLGLLASEMKRLEDLGEDAVTDEAGKTTYTPRYQSLMDEATKLQGELRGFYQSKYRTPSVPTAPTAGVGDTTKTPPSAPFTETMAKLSGSEKPAADGAPVIPDLTPKERIQGIDVIKNDPDALLQATRSPQRSEKEKNEALAHLKKFVESPKFPFGTTTREANSRISNLMEQIKEAERNVRMIPELEAYRKAWTEEKKDMELKIKDFAKSRGVDFDLTLADLAKEEPASNDPEETFTVRDQFEEFLNKEYDYGPIPRALSIGRLNIPAGRLIKFKDSEFAKEFGWWQPIPFLRLPIERGDVLDAYLAEKFPNQGDNQGQSTNAAANTVANITTEAEFDKLPIGAKFTFGSGEIRTKERERKK